MLERLTSQAQQALSRAQAIAREHQHNCIGTAHLFLGVLDVEFAPTAPLNSRLRNLYALHEFKVDEVRLYAESALELELTPSTAAPSKLELSSAARSAMELATRIAVTPEIGTEHIFLACLRPQQHPCVANVLQPLELPAKAWELVLWGSRADTYSSDHPLGRLVPETQKAIDNAYEAMRASYCGRISTLHLLLGILADPSNRAHLLFKRLNLDVEALRNQALTARTNDSELATNEKRFTPTAKRALDRAKECALQNGQARINTAHLFVGLLPRPATRGENMLFGKDSIDEAAPLFAVIPPTQIAELLKAQSKILEAPPSRIPAICTFTLGTIGMWGLQFSPTESVQRTPLEWTWFAILCSSVLVPVVMILWTTLFSKRPSAPMEWAMALMMGFCGAVVGAIL